MAYSVNDRRGKHGAASGTPVNDTLRLRDWYATKKAGEVATRFEIFHLLGWYHRTQVQPKLTFRYWLVRWYFILRGKRELLADPWEQLRDAIAQKKAERAIVGAMERDELA